MPSSYPLLWLSQAPYAGSRGRAGLDVVLAFAVFAQSPEVLFSGDAVLALLMPADTASPQRPALRRIIDSLPLYDVEEIWVEGSALRRHGIDATRLPETARVLEDDALRALIDNATHVLSL